MPNEVVEWTAEGTALAAFVRHIAARMASAGAFPSAEELCRWDARLAEAVHDVPPGPIRNSLHAVHLVTDGDPARTLESLLELLEEQQPGATSRAGTASAGARRTWP